MIRNPNWKTWLTPSCDNKHGTLNLEHNMTKCKRKLLNIVDLCLYTAFCTAKQNLNLEQNQNTYQTKLRAVVIVEQVRTGPRTVRVRINIVTLSNKLCIGILGSLPCQLRQA